METYFNKIQSYQQIIMKQIMVYTKMTWNQSLQFNQMILSALKPRSHKYTCHENSTLFRVKNILGGIFMNCQATIKHAYNYRQIFEMDQHATAKWICFVPTAFESKIANEVNIDSQWMNMKLSVLFQWHIIQSVRINN